MLILVITAKGVVLMVKILQSFKFELPFLFSVFTCGLYFFTYELLGLELFCTFGLIWTTYCINVIFCVPTSNLYFSSQLLSTTATRPFKIPT